MGWGGGAAAANQRPPERVAEKWPDLLFRRRRDRQQQSSSNLARERGRPHGTVPLACGVWSAAAIGGGEGRERQQRGQRETAASAEHASEEIKAEEGGAAARPRSSLAVDRPRTAPCFRSGEAAKIGRAVRSKLPIRTRHSGAVGRRRETSPRQPSPGQVRYPPLPRRWRGLSALRPGRSCCRRREPTAAPLHVLLPAFLQRAWPP